MRTEIGKSLAPILGAFENRMRHTQGDAAVPTTARAAEEAPPKAAGLPALKPRAAKKSTSTDTETNIATPSSASASGEDIAHMVRSISQVFAEQKQNGESAQRATSASNLRAVFSAFDANGDGCLDLDEFQALIGACGVQPGDDEKGRKMFMGCAKASRKIRRSVGDAILPEAFVAVCEKHGIEMAIKPTVAVSGGAL